MVKIIDYFKRRKAIRKITRNQGFVVETEDKIICYIQKKKCRRKYWGYSAGHYIPTLIYCINCSDYKYKYRELVKKYNLDKKVVYVLEGLDFYINVNIEGDESDLEIRNCNFHKNLNIMISGNCIIRSTRIKPDDISPLVDIRAKEISMDDVSISHISNNTSPYWGKVFIDTPNQVDIKNSKITMGNIILKIGRRLEITNSLLDAFNMQLGSPQKINSQSSKVIARNELKIETEEFEGLTIKAPKIFFNGQLHPHRDGTKEILLRLPNEIEKLRIIAIRLLKEIEKKIYAENPPIVNGKKCERGNIPVSACSQKRK